MRSRKLPSAGAAGLRGTCAAREPGLFAWSSDERGVGFADDVCGLGRFVAAGLPLGTPLLLGAAEASSCFARDAAVGAIRREGKSMVLVASLGLGFELVVDCLLEVEKFRSEPAALATEEAVGAVSELRLAFSRGCWEGVDFGDPVFAGSELRLALFEGV